MTQLYVIKTMSGALAPADAVTSDFIAQMRLGSGLHADFKRARDLSKHRRAFALFKFAFDLWDAPQLEYRGQTVSKSFERFRRDLTILAGHYVATTSIKGEVRLEAKSLSFANMDDTEFLTVYRDVLTATWEHVLKAKGYESPERVDAVVNELLRFE